MSKPISFRVSNEMKSELELRANNRGITVSDYLKEIVAKELQIETFQKMQEVRENQEADFDQLKEHAEKKTQEVLSLLEGIKQAAENTKRQTNQHKIRRVLIANIVFTGLTLVCSAYVASKFFEFW